MEREEIVNMGEDIAKYVSSKYINSLKRPEDISANDVLFAMGVATGVLGYSIAKAMIDRGAKAHIIGS